MEALENIVLAARSGDRRAYDTLVVRFADYAHGRAYAVLGDYQLAQDAVQDAFAEAFLNLEKLRDPAAFPGWFRRIVIKRIDRLIRGKRIPTVPLDEGIDSYDTARVEAEFEDDGDLRDTLDFAIDALPGHERDIAKRYYFDQDAQRDIAEDLNVPTSTVKKRLHTSRQRLKKSLADLNDQDDEFDIDLSACDALFAAARNGYPSRAETILLKHPELVRAVNEDGLGILLYAAHSAHYSGKNAVVDLLVARGARPDFYAEAALGLTDRIAHEVQSSTTRIDEPGPWQRTALHWAASGEHTALSAWLLSHDADPNAADRWGCTPLHLAAELGHAALLETLVRRGADIHARLKNGKSVLHLAAQGGNPEAVRVLVRHGAVLDVFGAATLGLTDTAHKMFRRDPYLLNTTLPFGATPLHMAAESGRDAMAHYLVERGAEIDILCATELGWIDEVARFLASAPEAVGTKGGSFGFTPLHTATSKGRRDLARLLLANGAPMNATDDMYNKTPLGEALYYGNESMARLLYKFGAKA